MKHSLKTTTSLWNEIEQTMEELIEGQKASLLQLGRRIIPTLTPEDVLQPNDFQELEYNPSFRYEEGILAGIQTLQMAIRALERRLSSLE